ncbi:putative bacteriophage protein [Escherichia coli DEC5C]|nr:putative bacteriophage protein [Escherichia coli DEC5C]EHV40196.1 putative bacteriophage protein [Escherichia coli DEC5D]
MEPFDWMLSVAKRENRLADDVRLLRQEEQERRKNIEKLIQIERNAKARIRRATKSRTE